MRHNGNLIIRKDNAGDFAALEHVSGHLEISADAQLPALTSVGGSLDISADAQLPALTSVGGSLYISADAQLPALTSVGGYLEIRADAQLPALETVWGFDIAKGDLAASRFAAVAREALQPDALNMKQWHSCETCHCIAGWAEVIAKREGRKYPGVSPAVIGAIELGVEAAKLFFRIAEDDRDAVIAALEAARDAVPVVEAA